MRGGKGRGGGRRRSSRGIGGEVGGKVGAARREKEGWFYRGGGSVREGEIEAAGEGSQPCLYVDREYERKGEERSMRVVAQLEGEYDEAVGYLSCNYCAYERDRLEYAIFRGGQKK